MEVTRRMLLLYSEPILNLNCDPQFQKALRGAIASASTSATGDSYVVEDVANMSATGCDGWTPPMGNPTQSLSNSIGVSGRRLSVTEVIADWSLRCGTAAACSRIIEKTTDPFEGSRTFKREFASAIYRDTGHTFFVDPEGDIRLQGANGCLEDPFQCSGQGDIVQRDPETCLFPGDRLFGSNESCPTGLPWWFWLAIGAAGLVLLITCVVALYLAWLTMSRRRKRRSSARECSDSDSSGDEASSDEEHSQELGQAHRSLSIDQPLASSGAGAERRPLIDKPELRPGMPPLLPNLHVQQPPGNGPPGSLVPALMPQVGPSASGGVMHRPL